MKISIVIPVYNEATELGACLRAIAKQATKPHEVIVVDNNSTDNSVSVAKNYDFVKLASEPLQGVAHARTRGFELATGDVIARIDADTRIPANWLQTVKDIFSDADVSAVSGSARYYDLSAAKLFNAEDLRLRKFLAKRLNNRQFLWGANMAITKTAWRAIEAEVCYASGIHEDFDIALHLQQNNFRVIFEEKLVADVSSRRINVSYLEFLTYAYTSLRSYKVHNAGHRIAWSVVIFLAFITYLPWHIMHRGYDKKQNKFSLRQLLFEKTPARVDPSNNVA